MLQVEQQNHDARALYGRCGFDELFEEENGRALRPRPGRQTRVSALLLMENDALLEEVPPSINWSTPSKNGWARACCGVTHAKGGGRSVRRQKGGTGEGQKCGCAPLAR